MQGVASCHGQAPLVYSACALCIIAPPQQLLARRVSHHPSGVTYCPGYIHMVHHHLSHTSYYIAQLLPIITLCTYVWKPYFYYDTIVPTWDKSDEECILPDGPLLSVAKIG